MIVGLKMLQRPRNNTRTLIYCGIVFASGLGPALAADPTGDWKVADGVANIRVAECNGSMWGVVASEKTPGGLDKNNPDASKQNRPTLGMPILLDMKKKPGTEQWEGQVYNAKDGKLYDSTIKLSSPDQLEIQGCILGFLCGGETWSRVAGPIPSSPANSLAKSSPPKVAGSKTSATAPASTNTGTKAAIPPAKTAASPTPKPAGQKTATTGLAPADPLGDICLLPDIARAPH